MDWETQVLPLLKAVARAIDANDGGHVNAAMVNSQLDEPLTEERLDRRLGELERAAVASLQLIPSAPGSRQARRCRSAAGCGRRGGTQLEVPA